MHETSLIQYTLDAVERRALAMGIRHVKRVYLVVGDLRGALPDLMQYGFRILTRSRPLFTDAVLEIEGKKVVLRCSRCGREYSVEEFHGVTCPDCGAPDYTVVQGNELYIDSFEGE